MKDSTTNQFSRQNIILEKILFEFQMVTVAKSFEAPIKLVMPQDLLENGNLEFLISRIF